MSKYTDRNLRKYEKFKREENGLTCALVFSSWAVGDFTNIFLRVACHSHVAWCRISYGAQKLSD